jgi:hypothetical protein
VFASNASAVWSLRVNTNGTVSVYGITQDNTLIITGTINVCDGNWHWIEARAEGGYQALYVDNLAQGTNSQAGTGFVAYFGLQAIGGSVVNTFDDIVVYDNTAGFPTNGNTPLNARQIITTRPTSDGTCTFSTLSAGTSHFSLVNETVPDGDTTYVQDGTSGDQDLLNMGALGSTPTAITCVMENLYVENPTGGAISVNAVCHSGATTSLGTAVVVPLVYQTLQFPFPTDPNTSAAWTASGLNAAQFGYKVP